MSNLFLNKDELRELTGYQMQSAQKRWLSSKKLPYITGADGMPRVLRQALLARFKVAMPQEESPKEPRLRF